MITALSSQIWTRGEFQRDYAALLVAARQKEWNLTEPAGEGTSHVDRLARLLQAATHFAGSENPEHRQAAYRVAIAAWFVTGGATSALLDVVALILGRLGNLPVLDFLHDHTRELWKTIDLPLPLWLENVAHEKDNTVLLRDTAALRLTDFQAELWRALSSGNTVIVNAPTSAGKSFALQHYLVEMLNRGTARICVYLVPSRALITQVSHSFRHLLSARGMADVVPATIPQTPDDLGAARVIYVLTQERLQMLIDRLPTLRADFVVVDEAQMVAEDARGIVLQTAVERLQRNNPEGPLLFGSPTASNPEIFARLFRLKSPSIVKAEESPVAQDLILVSLDDNEPTQGTVHLRVGTAAHRVGTVLFGSVLAKPEHILTHVARHFGCGQQSLVYVGSPDSCEKVATMMLEMERHQAIFPVPTAAQRAERTEFAEFLRQHFHTDYELANIVEHGIAFHYGGMPSTIRQALEVMFSSGALHTLVCTATLLHGVNLPARNLFLYDPTKGGIAWRAASRSLSSSEFWNLAGRAGRLKKEFSGNVFLIAPDRWRERPYEGSPRQQVQPALAEQITKRREELLVFIADRHHPSGKDDVLENAFMRLVNDLRRERLDETLSFLSLGEAAAAKAALLPTLERACDNLTVPKDIAEANASVSIFRQQEMLDLLRAGIATRGPEEFLPKHPMQPTAWQSLVDILARLHRVYLKLEDRSHTYFATIAIQWMQGQTYEDFIKYQWGLKQKAYDKKDVAGQRRGSSPKLAAVIRGVFTDIENNLRFKYVKYTKCYMDLLRHALTEKGQGDVADRLVPIPLYLELGASSVTMVNLIGLGLSRLCAAIVAKEAPSASMARPELIAWLRQTNLSRRGLSPVVLREVATMVST